MKQVIAFGLEAKQIFDLSKSEQTKYVDIADGCTLTKLLKANVPGKIVKEEISKLGEPYSYNVSHLNPKNSYDLYAADVTYNMEEGDWGKHVIAIPSKQVHEMQRNMANRERGAKLATAVAKKINPDNVNAIIAGLVKHIATDYKLAKIAAKSFQAAADTVCNGTSSENDFWNELQ